MAFCSVSGNVPEHPVVSTKSGYLFERSIVEKYVKETGKCPITQETLSMEDLLPIKANKTVKPRTAASTSIPGMLAAFHDEWDALMLELHSVRSSLHQTRQELSHALYQHDAAVRVIAKLMRERDDARSALENAKAQVKAEMEADEASGEVQAKAGILEAVLADMSEVNAVLSKGRKKRPVPDTLATPEELAGMCLSGSHPLHATKQGGITALDVNPEVPAVVATAGNDCSVQVFDYVQGRVLASLQGHSKRLTSVAYITPEVLLSASADKTVRVWRGPSQAAGEFTCSATLKDHTAEVVGVVPHPSRRYFVSASADASWAFYDLETLTCLKQVGGAEGPGEPYSALQFHPDGLILGTGTEGKAIRIWEVRQQKNVATFEGHAGAVRGLCFSENGFHLASVSDDGVKLWDLRKLKNFKSLEPFGDSPLCSVAFDHSGQYLAVGGGEVRVFGQKQEWAEVAKIGHAPKRALCLRWGADARTLLVGGHDHNLRLYGVKA